LFQPTLVALVLYRSDLNLIDFTAETPRTLRQQPVTTSYNAEQDDDAGVGGEGKILYNVMSVRKILVWEERVRYCTM